MSMMKPLDVIHQAGPGGQFMTTDHTLEHWRQLWTPRLFDRQRLERWEARGAKDINQRLREKTISILESHSVKPLPDGVEAEIEMILNGRAA
jgi:trimethylamine--corrinoid protein Co-methyltransferase